MTLIFVALIALVIIAITIMYLADRRSENNRQAKKEAAELRHREQREVAALRKREQIATKALRAILNGSPHPTLEAQIALDSIERTYPKELN